MIATSLILLRTKRLSRFYRACPVELFQTALRKRYPDLFAECDIPKDVYAAYTRQEQKAESSWQEQEQVPGQTPYWGMTPHEGQAYATAFNKMRSDGNPFGHEDKNKRGARDSGVFFVQSDATTFDNGNVGDEDVIDIEPVEIRDVPWQEIPPRTLKEQTPTDTPRPKRHKAHSEKKINN